MNASLYEVRRMESQRTKCGKISRPPRVKSKATSSPLPPPVVPQKIPQSMSYWRIHRCSVEATVTFASVDEQTLQARFPPFEIFIEQGEKEAIAAIILCIPEKYRRGVVPGLPEWVEVVLKSMTPVHWKLVIEKLSEVQY
jgi:hypothetical protein